MEQGPEVIDSQWLKDQLKDKGKSQADLARFLKYEPAVITRIINGRRRLQLEECKQLARFLGIAVDDVLKHAGIKLRQVTPSGKALIPIVGMADHNGQVRMGSGEATTSMDLPADAMAIRMQEPDGWTAFMLNDRQPPDMMIQRLVVAHCDDGSYWLGELRRGYEAGLFNLVPIKGRQMDGLAIDFCQPVAWIRPAQ